MPISILYHDRENRAINLRKKRPTLNRLIVNIFIFRWKKMKSCVIFAYSDRNDSIVKYLEIIKGLELLVHEDKKYSVQIKLEWENLNKLN